MSDKERETSPTTRSATPSSPRSIPGLDPVHKISIVQRGFGALGYTMQLPLEERYLIDAATDLMGELAVLLGGRTAEEIAFGEMTTGAQNDLLRATDIARAMVCEFGMSETLGLINYDGNKRPKFLDIAMPQERGLYSEETALKIDERDQAHHFRGACSRTPDPHRTTTRGGHHREAPAERGSDGRRRTPADPRLARAAEVGREDA